MEAPAIAIFRHGLVERTFMDCYFVYRNPVDRNLRKHVFDRGATTGAIQLPVPHGAMRLQIVGYTFAELLGVNMLRRLHGGQRNAQP